MGSKESYKSRSVVKPDGEGERKYHDSCYALGPEYIAALDRASAPWKPMNPDICYVCGKYLQKSVPVRRGKEEWVELSCECPGRLVLVRHKEAPPPPKPWKVEVSVEVRRAIGSKCPRCWNYHAVEGNPMGCCDRCVSAVTESLPFLVAEGRWTEADAEEWRGLAYRSAEAQIARFRAKT
jgi:hypothetical protein